MSMQIPVVKLLKKKNYLTMIRNAARGENYMFRNLYMTIDGEPRDGASDGTLSCAIFVCSVLYLMDSQGGEKLIDYIHANIPSTERDLIKNGWQRIEEPRDGAILIWEAVKGQSVPVYGDMHYHIGFSLGNDRAISNDSDGRGIPAEHHYTFGTNEDDTPKRSIEKIYWHPSLDQD